MVSEQNALNDLSFSFFLSDLYCSKAPWEQHGSKHAQTHTLSLDLRYFCTKSDWIDKW